MKYTFSFLWIAFVVAFTACSTSSTRKAPNGFEVQVLREGTGSYAEPGSYLVMNMMYKDDKDSVWFDTKKLKRPGVKMITDTSTIRMEKGIEGIFRVLKKGDSIAFKVTAKSLFEESWQMQIPPGVKPDGYLTFAIGVADILDDQGMAELREKITRAQQKAQIGADTTAIDSYLAAHNIQAQRTKEGVRYVITKQGSGAFPLPTNTVKVNYRGSFLVDGTEFDRSDSPIELLLSDFIPGWQIGVMKMQKGSKATLYVPSSLAYGANGSPPVIPGNANLIFEVELLEIK